MNVVFTIFLFGGFKMTFLSSYSRTKHNAVVKNKISHVILQLILQLPGYEKQRYNYCALSCQVCFPLVVYGNQVTMQAQSLQLISSSVGCQAASLLRQLPCFGRVLETPQLPGLQAAFPASLYTPRKYSPECQSQHVDISEVIHKIMLVPFHFSSI